jgi:hypothetical protein
MTELNAAKLPSVISFQKLAAFRVSALNQDLIAAFRLSMGPALAVVVSWRKDVHR